MNLSPPLWFRILWVCAIFVAVSAAAKLCVALSGPLTDSARFAVVVVAISVAPWMLEASGSVRDGVWRTFRRKQ